MKFLRIVVVLVLVIVLIGVLVGGFLYIYE